MIKVNLDTNIVIKATKPDEQDHELAIWLIELHKENKLRIQVIAAIASEYKRSMNGSGRSLETDLHKLGLSDSVKIVPIPAIVGMSYLDYSYLVGDETTDLLHSVWSVLFAPAPFDHNEFCQYNGTQILDDSYVDRKWQNYMCDVLTVLGYIDDCKLSHHSLTDVNILVTADEDDILKNAKILADFGAKKILSLKDTVHELKLKLS